MSDTIITCDVDGVLADGRYLFPEEQTANGFATLDVADPMLPGPFNLLAAYNPVYLLTSRKHEDVPRHLRRWLCRKGFVSNLIAGILYGISTERKLEVATSIGARYHIDDAPEVVLCYNRSEDGTIPLLLHNPHRDPYPYLQYNNFFPNWETLASFLRLRGLLGA